MSSEKLAIRISNLSKCYQIYDAPRDRLKASVYPRLQRLIGTPPKQYSREFWALKDVSLEINKGEAIGIVGRNGSGKSTLLQLICGILSPTSGSMKTRGRISALLELGSGFNPDFTGRENVFINGAILGLSQEEIEARFEGIAAFADIGDFIEQPVKTYSTGMMMRLAFSVAVIVDPDILIIDEALAVGDALFQRKCFAKINNFMEDGKTVLFVSHSIDAVTQLCQRALLLDAGEVILDAKPKLIRPFYFKILYSSADQYHKIREEIKRINLNKEYKETLGELPLKDNGAGHLPESLDIEGIGNDHIKERDFYLPDFLSKSMDRTKNYDIDIYDVCIKNAEGTIVNHIHSNHYYTYSYKIKFHAAANKVTFRTVFKMTTGLIISVAETPGKFPFKCIEHIASGEEFIVDCHFKCNLLTGIYYTNAAVWGSNDKEERDVLSMITDALVFQVQDAPGNIYSGIFHLEQRVQLTKI